MNSIVFAFLLTLVAGLSTGIGSFIAFFSRTSDTRFLSVCLGFSAGVMVYVSFVEIFAKARDLLCGVGFGADAGLCMVVAGFFGGIVLIALIDKFIPNYERVMLGGIENGQDKKVGLRHVGVFTAVAIMIHNFPEGLATFISASQDASIAVPIVIAIAVHNIPEGIAVSVPIYYATGSRKRAFVFSFLSGLTEPLGAVIGYLILLPFMSDVIFGILFAAVAGIMVFISIDELLPAARDYGKHHLSVYGFVVGMAVMAVSLVASGIVF